MPPAARTRKRPASGVKPQASGPSPQASGTATPSAVDVCRSDARQPVEGGDGPRWSRIATDLAEAIERGDHADGASLPAAAAVAERYGVNRHTVRQAFRYLQDLGLVSVERGRGTIVQARRFPYRLGRRVSLRANFGAAGLDVEGEILTCEQAPAAKEHAPLLALAPGAPIWQILMLNRAAGRPVSMGMHRLSIARFPDFDRRLVAARSSISAAFATFGIHDYVRLSTRLSARPATRTEVRSLELGRGACVLQSIAIDGLEDGTPLQAIDGAFAAERVEMVIEPQR